VDQRDVVLADLVVLGQVGVEVVLAVEPAPLGDLAVERQPEQVASSTACALTTGSAPGWPVQTGQTLVLGSPPKSVEQPHHILVRVVSSTWTSSPTTAPSPRAAPSPAVLGRGGVALISSRRTCRSSGHLHGPRSPAGSGENPSRLLEGPRRPRYIRSSRSSGAISCRPTGSEVPGASGASASPAGSDSAGMPGERRGHGRDVVEVHRDRVGGLGPEPERHRRRGGADQHVACSNAAAKSRRSACGPCWPAGSRRRSSRDDSAWVPIMMRRLTSGPNPAARVAAFISSAVGASTRRP
jgi:hypothetical protein